MLINLSKNFMIIYFLQKLKGDKFHIVICLIYEPNEDQEE